jgi:hypothetical protein
MKTLLLIALLSAPAHAQSPTGGADLYANNPFVRLTPQEKEILANQSPDSWRWTVREDEINPRTQPEKSPARVPAPASAGSRAGAETSAPRR